MGSSGALVRQQRTRQDIGSVLLLSREFIQFFDPRRDRWVEHFRLDEVLIVPLTSIGEVTAQIKAK